MKNFCSQKNRKFSGKSNFNTTILKQNFLLNTNFKNFLKRSQIPKALKKKNECISNRSDLIKKKKKNSGTNQAFDCFGEFLSCACILN